MWAQHRYGEKAAGDAMRALNAIVRGKAERQRAKAAAQKAQTQTQPQEASATSPVEELRTAIGHVLGRGSGRRGGLSCPPVLV